MEKIGNSRESSGGGVITIEYIVELKLIIFSGVIHLRFIYGILNRNPLPRTKIAGFSYLLKCECKRQQ